MQQKLLFGGFTSICNISGKSVMTNQWHREEFFKAGKIAWNKSISIIISYAARRRGPAGESVGGFSPTIAHKMFGTNSNFRVK